MSRRHGSFVVFATTLFVSNALSFIAIARAQDVLLDIKSPVVGADASHPIAIGDWDGDGIGDIAIGAPRDGTVATDAGAVRVASGANGSVIATIYGVNADDQFGNPLARMPDLNGDGIDDLAVSAIYADYGGTDTGSVYLYAGGTGAFLRRIDGPAASTYFGLSVGSLGDVDGDGIADLHASRRIDYLNCALDVCSGATGSVIQTFLGPAGENFGCPACAIDDLDGDGVRELLVGAVDHVNPAGQTGGAAYVISTKTGATLRLHEGTYNYEELGSYCAALSDLDGDGVHDYAVSAQLDDIGYSSKVVVYSAASGAQLGTFETTSRDRVDTQVADAGDVNGDGVGDIAISGSWVSKLGRSGGATYLISGRTLLTLDRIDLPYYVSTSLVAPFADLNGDGFDDLLVGSIDASLDGEVQVYAGNSLWLDATPSETYAGDTLKLNTREGAPGTPTILVLESIDGAPTFQILGGVRTFGPLGGNLQLTTVPSGLRGHEFTLRAYANDPARGVVASAAQQISCR